jgi:hypothetical protein
MNAHPEAGDGAINVQRNGLHIFWNVEEVIGIIFFITVIHDRHWVGLASVGNVTERKLGTESQYMKLLLGMHISSCRRTARKEEAN